VEVKDMPLYPLQTPHDPYRGWDAKKLEAKARFDRLAAKVTKHINDEVKARGPGNYVFTSGMVSIELGEDRPSVERVFWHYDASYNVSVFASAADLAG
jgi:hypothetical protein